MRDQPLARLFPGTLSRNLSGFHAPATASSETGPGGREYPSAHLEATLPSLVLRGEPRPPQRLIRKSR